MTIAPDSQRELFLMSPPGPNWQLRGRANFRSGDAKQVCADAAFEEWLCLGVSLLSAASGIGAGAMIKALTLKMNNASRLRGVSRWSAPAIRAHVSVGPLQLLSRTPGPHENEAISFVYETSVANEHRLRESLRGEHKVEILDRVSLDDQGALDSVMSRVAEGEKLAIVSPGVDDERRVCLGHCLEV